MIRIEHFSKSYKGKTLDVEDITFSLEKGSVTALLGANGSGKSTVIKAMCAVHYPSSGNVFVSGKDNLEVNAEDNPVFVKECTGYVPEITELPKDMAVYDFLSYAAKVHNVEDFEKQVLEVIKKCSLNEVAFKKIGELSKGYRQRVSFAQGIIHQPENLILDELMSGLDPNQMKEMEKLILSYAKDHCVLISTHILGEVHNLCKNIVIMNKGKIVAQGTEKEIIEKTKSPDFETAFLKVCS